MAQLGFDASQVQPDTGQLDPVPAGWYIVMADESEVKPTADGLGARLAVRFSIVDGQFANRKIYTGFNIRNANPVAQEIAFKQLSALAHAVGVLKVDTSEQLHNIPLKVRVKIRPPKDGYDAQNEITAYKNINEDVGGPAAAGAAGAAPGAPTPPTPPGGPAMPPAAPPAPAGAGWGGAPTQPWQGGPAAPTPAAPAPAAPPVPAAPSVPAPPPVAAPFPPEGWLAHPSAAGYFYKGQEVLTEAQLRERMATPAPPAVPSAPPAPAEAAGDPAAVAGVAVPPWQVKK